MKNKLKTILIRIKVYDYFINIYKFFKLKKAYKEDFNIYNKYYINNSQSKMNYSINQSKNYISYLVHSIEKGMTNSTPRPFGNQKIKNIILLLNNIKDEKECFEYNLGMSCLEAYLNLYKKMGWVNKEEYKIVFDYLKDKQYKTISVGARIIKKSELICKDNYYNLLSTRHSVRNFENKKILDTDIEKAIKMAMLTPSACNRQMCKIYYISNSEYKNLIIKLGQGFGNFNVESVNIFIITFDINSNISIGERNQGWFNSGLLGMNFVNALHSIGIGSCFVQFGNSYRDEKIIKEKLEIPSNERIAVILAAGYYTEEEIVPYSSRKNIDSYYKKI